MSKTEIKLVKPTYVGFSILDLSKTFMYDFYYNKMVKRYGSRVKLLITDTDSFILHVQTSDVYRDMVEDINAYETSDYPQNHFAYNVKNKKVLGKMKDELNGRPVREFVGLRPKMYSLLEADGREKKMAKGISKRVTDRLRHEEYRQALYNENSTTVIMQQIRSMKYDVFTVSLRKTGLSPYDDKRYVLSDRITTLAYSHYKTVLENDGRMETEEGGGGEGSPSLPLPPPKMWSSFDRRRSTLIE